MRPRLFDASALVALHQAHPVPFGILEDCHDGKLKIVVPATALAVANATIRATNNEWEAILLTAGFTVVPLVQHAAIEIGPWMVGDLATRHVVHEVRAVRGVVVTCDPDAYEEYDVPLLSF